MLLTEGSPLHGHRRPGDGPTVVLLHGITDAGACWGPIADALDPTYDLVMPDARGHGDSPLPEGPVGLTQLADDVAGLVDALGPGDDGAVLIGHSLGAATATALAVDRPELARALVLEDPPWRGAAATTAPRVDHAAWVRQLQQLDHAGRLAEGRATDPGWSDAELEAWAASKAKVDLAFFDRYEHDTLGRWSDVVGRLTTATLLVTGDPDRGAIVTPSVAAQVRQLAPQVHTLHLDGAGHSIHRDRPDAFVDGVHAFLHEVFA